MVDASAAPPPPYPAALSRVRHETLELGDQLGQEPLLLSIAAPLSDRPPTHALWPVAGFETAARP